MPFLAPAISFNRDCEDCVSVTAHETRALGDLLREALSGARSDERPSWWLRQRVEDLLGIDLSVKSLGSRLATPLCVAPATWSQHPRQVERLLAMGVPCVGLKTVVAESPDGQSAGADEFRGNRRRPDLEFWEYPVFVSGERGSHLGLEDYLQQVLAPSARAAVQHGAAITGSLAGPSLADSERSSRIEEWRHTARRIAQVLAEVESTRSADDPTRSSVIAVDFPPYLAGPPADSVAALNERYVALCDDVVEIVRVCRAALGDVGAKEHFHIVPKLSFEMRPVLRAIVRRLAKLGMAEFIAIGRDLGAFVDPRTLEMIETGAGGTSLLAANLRALWGLRDPDSCEASYTGGLRTGGDAVAALSIGNISRLEMVSEFYFRGMRSAYARVLGGLAVRLAHLQRGGGLGEGLPRSPRDLNGRARARPPDAAAAAAPPLVAVIDLDLCSDCRERSIGQPEGGCRAAETCPGFAFQRRVADDGRGYWWIDPGLCLGCGTCVPVRGGCGAISLREREGDHAA